MAKRILWLSQHCPIQEQAEGLRQLFGEVEILRDVNSFANAREILRRFLAGGYDDMVVVAPQTVIDHLCRLGFRPLYSITEEVGSRQEADFVYNGRNYKFIRFRRVKGIRWEWADVNSPCYVQGNPKED